MCYLKITIDGRCQITGTHANRYHSQGACNFTAPAVVHVYTGGRPISCRVTEERRKEIAKKMSEISQLLAYRQTDDAKDLKEEMDALRKELGG